jgi:dipeptidyl aminopeptidase/acylaminoacyl peptidase
MARRSPRYRHFLVAFLLCAPLAAQSEPAVPPAAATARPPIEAFFANPVLASPQLSPSGKYIALRASKQGSREYLVVLDVATDTTTVVAAYGNVDVARFQWVNDDRLLYDVTDKRLPPSTHDFANGLFAVNRDGSRPMQLADRNGYTPEGETGTRLPPRKLLPWHTFMLGQRGAEDSEFVYVESVHFDAIGRARQANLLRLNTLTGQASTVAGPEGTASWLLDQHGQPRVATALSGNTITNYYRDPANGQWRVLSSSGRFVAEDPLTPVGFGPDGTFYVEAYAGKDTSALHSFNFGTGKINPDPVVRTAGYDFTGGLISTRSKLLGVHFVTDAQSEEWLDADMRRTQQQVDKLLPGTINLLSVASSPQTPWVLVTSFSDTLPATYLVYNSTTGQVKKIGASYPAIDSRQMGRQQPVRYKARDGMDIPGLLTLPPGGKRNGLPMVMLVHGGPFAPGASWGWDAQSQFLASRGYAVLEPAFRGTTGLGAKHFRAGWKQWGLAMQDDLADAARWAVAQGIADPKRICIAGASYGGYATLMGLAKDAGLYKCGIDWLGVTDINLLYTGTWHDDSDLSEEWKAYGMPVLVGDPVKDAAQLQATSPIEQAARIRQPLLLAYGRQDERVPITHGKRFLAAVRQANPNVEWVEYPEEGHGWAVPETRIDFWSRVERFLDRQIGNTQ